MQSRPLGAILAALVTVATASAQYAPIPDLPPSAAFPSDGAPVPADGRISAAGLGLAPDPYRWWLSGEYLLGFTKSAGVPPVVSAGPAASNGIIGLPGTRLLESSSPKFDSVSGGRLSGGVWLDSCRAYGVEWSVFFLPRQQSTSTFQAAPGEALARPFFDTVFNVENSRLISAPGLFAGSAESTYRTYFWGGEFGTRLRVLETPTLSLEQLFHFRHYTLEESFTADDNSTALPGGVVAFNGQVFGAPARVRVNDTFEVLNRFYGGSAGLRVIWTPGRWEVRLDGRMGVGTMEQNVTIDGRTSLENVGGTASTQQGFYTAAHDTGTFRRYRLSLAPDVQGRVGYRVADWLMVTAGYQFLYMTNVARPGDLIDRRLSSARIPSSQTFGAASPAVRTEPVYESRDFWMHGFTAGVMLTF
jgi:hypothetical protein